jgi:hypothetical protein
LLVFAVLTATGAHWAVLQSVAWTTMLADNLRASSLHEAVERTFDGRHPCSLCKALAEGKKSGPKSEFPLQLKKFEFLQAPVRFVFLRPAHFYLLTTSDFFVKSVSQTPPTPPPRFIFA